MEASEEFYQQVVDGTADARELRLRVGLVRRRVRQSRTGEVADRMTALKATSNLDIRAQLDLLPLFLPDEAREVRQYAMNLIIATQSAGSRILRSALTAGHIDIALQALDLLTRGVERGATSQIQKLITHGNAEIRAASARYLGHAGGPSLMPRLNRMLADPDHRVAHAAELAIERLKGERPKLPTGEWWNAPPLEDEDPPSEAEIEPVQLDNFELPPPPTGLPMGTGDIGGLSALSGLGPAPSAAPSLPPLPPPLTERAAPTPLPPVTDLSRRPTLAWEPDEASNLPSPLPTEAGALAKLISRVSAADRGAVAIALEATGSDAKTAIDRLTRATEPRDRAAAALAVGELQMKSKLSTLTRLLRDTKAPVRAAAAAAMAPVAGASALGQLSRLFSDADPEVRAAAANAMGAAAVRLDQQGFARSALGRLDADPDDGVVQAVQAAKALLGG